MAKNRLAPFSISLNFENESSENNILSFATPPSSSLPDTTTNINSENVIMTAPPPGAPSSGSYIGLPQELKEGLTPPSSKRSKGRPKGSKNKPKPHVEIMEYPNTFMKPIVIEIAAGKDVMDSISKMAWRHQADISVLRGVGLVSNIDIHNPMTHARPITIQGPVQMISLSGTYINPNCDLVPSEFITDPDCSTFSIYLSGIHGQVFGGVVRGKVIASSVVLVTANLLLKPKFYTVASVNRGIPNAEKVDQMYGDVIIHVDRVAGANSSQPNHQVFDHSPANVNVN